MLVVIVSRAMLPFAIMVNDAWNGTHAPIARTCAPLAIFYNSVAQVPDRCRLEALVSLDSLRSFQYFMCVAPNLRALA